MPIPLVARIRVAGGRVELTRYAIRRDGAKTPWRLPPGPATVEVEEEPREGCGMQLVRSAQDGEAEVGERVTVLDLTTTDVDDYRLVDTEADRAADGEIAVDTALGSALLGSHVGDVIVVDDGGRVSRLEIVEIDG